MNPSAREIVAFRSAKVAFSHSFTERKATIKDLSIVSIFLAVTCILACLSVRPVRAQEATEMASLKLVPIDADIYLASFRLREQWDRFVAGPVVQELLESSGVENAVEQFRSEWKDRDGIGSNVRIFWENGNTQDVLAFLQELFSSEVFAFGDQGVSKWYFADAKMKDKMRNVFSSGQSSEEQFRSIMDTYLTIAGKLDVPTLVMGARCKSEDLALGKIDQLEAVLQFGVGASDQGRLFLKNLDRIDDARGNRLQLRLDGSQIPWDDIPTGEEFDDEAKDRVREVVEKKSMTITIGLLDGFFIAAISPSSKALLELGKAKSILEHPEMQPVRDAASLPITSISFTSDALNHSLYESFQNNAVSRFVSSNYGPLLKPLDADSEIRDFYKELLGDCEWMDTLIAKQMPVYKGATSLSYLTADGWENHAYSKTEDVAFDASAPIVSLEHLGKSPMMFLAARMQNRSEGFQFTRQIFEKAKARFLEAQELDWSELGWDFSDPNFILKMLEQPVTWMLPYLDWSKVEETFAFENIVEFMDLAGPSLGKLADAWESKLLPALSGEQAIVVSGGNLIAKQWYKDMPPSVDPLPLPELALLYGIKDAKLLNDGIEEVFKSYDEMVEAMRAKNPNSILVVYKIPRSIQSETVAGKKLAYEIPADCAVPKELMPHALFAGEYVINSYSEKQSMAMAAATKLNMMLGVIDSSAKQSNVSYINIGKIFEFARPWIRYALIEGMESLENSIVEDSFLYQMVGDNYDLTGKDLLSAWTVLSKFGEFSSVSRGLPTGGSHVRSVYKSQKSE